MPKDFGDRIREENHLLWPGIGLVSYISVVGKFSITKGRADFCKMTSVFWALSIHHHKKKLNFR